MAIRVSSKIEICFNNLNIFEHYSVTMFYCYITNHTTVGNTKYITLCLRILHFVVKNTETLNNIKHNKTHYY